MMLHKNPSQRAALLKYGLSAPLFALMVILSSATVKTNALVVKVTQKATQVLELKPQALTTQAITAAITNVEPTPKTADQPKADPNDMLSLAEPVADADTTDKKGPVFVSVEHTAEPPGGFENFYRFLGTNIRYPAAAREKGIQGRVICQFIVEQDGSLSNIKVVRGVEPTMDQEALRVLGLSKDWTPGKQNGKDVRQQYTMPIQFAIVGGASTTPATNRKLPPDPPTPPTDRNPDQVVIINRNGTGQTSTRVTSTNGPTIVTFKDSVKNPLVVKTTIPENVDYYLNGKPTTKAELNKVNVANIATINVYKAAPGDANQNGRVMIVTKK